MAALTGCTSSPLLLYQVKSSCLSWRGGDRMGLRPRLLALHDDGTGTCTRLRVQRQPPIPLPPFTYFVQFHHSNQSCMGML
ncbi:hypothetical protein BU24DRAFT_115162 [Aaosphaeria arxii CBS 175.79]|uniref:Uncharacterized protein n=1 Tax=Aaosphaeria arxii CBS 175.79 TaxID=1450172 RepID=A0A6A5Y152_9PLEO|nr:uncharacterized protein BU24DRAFT_115162 [Aaosphaeria arxii CBS 175.79]KAF2019228.1 hypothetical protein BU24DRAFT_115162 [Aaosphaeria arxii CBS 175.79]